MFTLHELTTAGVSPPALSLWKEYQSLSLLAAQEYPTIQFLLFC